MGLWNRLKRLIPISLIAAGAIAVCATLSSHQPSPNNQIKKEEIPTSYLFGKWFLCGTAISLATLGSLHLASHKKWKNLSFLQPAVEHPFVTAGVNTVSYSLASYLVVPQMGALNTVPGILCGAYSYLLTIGLNRVKPPYFNNSLRLLCDSTRYLWLEKDPVKKQQIIERVQNYASDPENVKTSLVDCLLEQEKIDEALDVVKEIIPNIRNLRKPSRFERYLIKPLAEEIVLQRHGTKYSFNLLFSKLEQGDLQGALQTLDDFVDQERDSNRLATRAFVSQAFVDFYPDLSKNMPEIKKVSQNKLEEKTELYWQDAITTILQDPESEQQFRLMGESRNEVLEYSPTRFLQTLLVFKRCDQKFSWRLKQERETALAYSERLGKRIVQSLAYIEHSEKAYHVLRHGTSTTLEDILKQGSSNERIKSLESSAQLLIQIQKSEFDWDCDVASDDYYEQRLSTVFYDQVQKICSLSETLLGEVKKTSKKIAEKLKDAIYGWYKDANPRNWLIEEEAVAIDFEHRIRLPIHFDFVSLLEFGPAVATDDEKRQILELAIEEYCNGSYTAEMFKEHYKYAGLQRHLELAGYRARDNEADAVRFHIRQAERYALEVEEYSLAKQLEAVII